MNGLWHYDKLQREVRIVKLFLYLLLQFIIFVPLTSLAADSAMAPTTQIHENTKITAVQKAKINHAYGKIPLYFVENNGQVNKKVSFYERGAGHATFFTAKGVTLALTKRESLAVKASFKKDISGLKAKESAKHTTEAVTLSFVGANAKAKISSNEKMPGHVNYFVGNDKSKWRSNIPTYGAVIYKDVYKNIDVKFYGNNKNIEHDVIVRPGGDFSNVKFAYRGIKGLSLTETGDLEVTLNHGKIIEERPVIYQVVKGKKVSVDGTYKILKGEDGTFTYGFNVASYDRTKDLVIDPVLVYSTYLGGNNTDQGWGIVIDDTGAAYVTGNTGSTDFLLLNPIQATIGGVGANDAFVTKINPAGTAIVYSTYLGGTGEDVARSIAVDATGAAYLTGQTDSADFPLLNPIQAALVGGIDSFVTKINPAGTAIVYSTYLGGGGIDIATGITLDNSGSAYITGGTDSTDFPLMNPIQAIFGGSGLGGNSTIGDAFAAKINPAGSALVYSTYLGGIDNDSGSSIAIDASGSAYVTGVTDSANFPLLTPIQATFGGLSDAFVTKINPAGSALVYSTYIGGSSVDAGLSIALDASGNAYIAGGTDSVDFPIMSPIQATHGGGLVDAFVTKINSLGSAYVYSTYIGGVADDSADSIAVDNSGAVYVTGATTSTNFPLTAPIQAIYGGGFWDAFVSKINPTGSAFVYSTYLGGSGRDLGRRLAVDSLGAVYMTGQTDSTDFPLMGPIQAANGGYLDAFITKISGTPAPDLQLFITPDVVSVARGGSLGYTVTATNNSVNILCFKFWENVSLPSGATYPAGRELLGPVNVCLSAGASRTTHLTHGVPVTAPVGTYIFNAFAGAHPTPIMSEAHFNFDITAFNPATKTPETSWRLIEQSIKK